VTPTRERAPILKEIDSMVAARSKKGDPREYVDANSLTDEEKATIIEEIKNTSLPERKKGETREQLSARRTLAKAWVREAWERLGSPKHFSRVKRRVAVLMVERKMAISIIAAEAMIRAGLIQDHYGRRVTDTKARCPENAQITLQTDRPTSRAVVFVNRKAAISSTTHALVREQELSGAWEGRESRSYEPPSPDSMLIHQEDLEAWIYRRRQFAEIDAPLAVALSKGATVQRGVHTAELLPMRNEDGSVHLKLVIR